MSHTIEVPGGTAEFYDKDELTPRRQRPMQEMALQLGDLLDRLAHAKKINGEADGLPGLNAPPVEISAAKAHDLATFSDIVSFMWLKAWTLEIPFPTSPDGMLDMPGPVYDLITKHAAQLHVKAQESDFEPSEETLTDPASPTGDSVV